MENTYSITTKLAEFFDLRLYLKAAVEELQTRGVFAHRTFNRDCGFSSPNFLQLVIQGKRNLSEDGARKVCRTLGLSKAETKLFLKMRELNLADNQESKFELLQDLLREPAFVERHQLSQEQLNYYSKWFNIPVRELLQSHPLITAAQIAETLIPNVSVEEIESSLRDMKKLGLIEESPKGWRVLHKQVATANEIVNHGLVQFHSSMISLARESLTRFSGAEREVSAITLNLTEEEFLALREKIREFKKEALANERAAASSRVYQFNFQLFPVTSRAKDGES